MPEPLAELASITDPAQRVRRATEIMLELDKLRDDTGDVRRTALGELQQQGKSQTEIADATGLSRQRLSQIMKAGPPPERALLAPEPRAAPLTIAIVRKRESDSGQPAIAETTRQAVDELRAQAAGLKLDSEWETVPTNGYIDLNRSNLAVLIGPRITPLIVQAISADPVIKWQQDIHGHWFITDTGTGSEFHSDFDEGWEPHRPGERSCIAHIGRIRRPDGNGSFLYLGGAHSPGTAGAVRYFIQEMPSLWEEVRRAPQWSAVVRTVAGDDGTPVSWGRVTPVYTHGRHPR